MGTLLQDVLIKGKFEKVLFDKKFGNKADLHNLNGQNYVVRTIGRQYNLTRERRAELHDSIERYYQFLRGIKILGVPEVFMIQYATDSSSILLLTEYFRHDLSNTGLTGRKRVALFQEILLNLLEMINLRTNLGTTMVLAIDPNPKNFMFNFPGKIYYNDFTPPLFREKGEWSEFRRSDELEAKKIDKEKRYFSRRGVILNFIYKSRLYLPVNDYQNLLDWTTRKINLSFTGIELKDSFVKLLTGSPRDIMEMVESLTADLTVRDILRFMVTKFYSFSPEKIEAIYKDSKKTDGVAMLRKIIEDNSIEAKSPI